MIYGEIKKDIVEILRTLCERKGVEIFEATACRDILSNDGSIPKRLIECSKKNGQNTAAKYQHISEVIARYPEMRMHFADYIIKICLDYELETKDVVLILKRVGLLPPL